MNISTTPRRVAQGLLVLCFTLAAMAGLRAQCSDFTAFPPGPIVINLTLDAFGNASLNEAVLNANGFVKDPMCYFWLSQTPAVLASYTNAPIPFSCADVATSPQTWHVRAGGNPAIGDDMGPGATIVPITINVIDNIPPTITCVANQLRVADPTCSWTAAGGEFDWVTANDNCATNITYTLTGATNGNGGSTVNGIVFGLGVTNVTWTVEDDALPTASQASCSFTVTVNDATPPTIMCPANVVAPNAPANGTCQWIGAGLGVSNAMVADNCASDAALLATLTNNITGPGNLNGYPFSLGVTNVTYTINDGVNPSVNCMFTVDVTDQTNPVVTCPTPAATYNTDPGVCQAVVTGLNATATDNCSVSSLTWAHVGGPALIGPGTSTPSNVSGAIFALGTTSIQYTVTDGAGLMHTCSFNVTVVDNQPPAVLAMAPSLVIYQSSFSVNNAPGTCSQNVSWYRPSILPCPAPPMPYDYTHCVSDNCPATFTIAELQPIMPDGNPYPGDFFFDNGVTPYIYDNSNPLHRTTPVSANFPIGVLPPTTLRYRVTDSNGQSTTLNITVAVAETENPVAKCVVGPAAITLDPSLGVAVVTPALINNGSTDNCGIQSMSVSPNLFDCNQLGNQNVTLKVTDNANNMHTCVTTVFVSDITLPVIGCPSSFVVPAGANCNGTVPGLIFNVGTSSPAVMEYFDNAMDPCGLTFDYQVNGLPIGFTPLGLYVSTPVNMSSIVFPAGNNSVTVRATDGSGNIRVCNFTVSVQDQTPPIYATGPNPGPTPGDTILANVPNLGSCSAKAIWNTPLFSDNCPGAVTIVSQSAFSNVTIFSADNGGITPVTYVVKDVAGNLYTYVFNVHAVDNQNPVAKCKDITVNLSATIGAGSVTVTPANVDDASTDNCGYTYVSTPVTYTCANLGANNYVLTISDNAGNTNSKTCVVTVKDITAPSFNCPANTTVNANTVCQGSLTGSAVATDNCSIATYEYDLNPPAPIAFALLNNGVTGNLANIPSLPLGVTTVTLRASDIGSPVNSSTCTFTVTVQDVTPPVFAGVPASVTVACNAIPPVTNPTATDNCGTATVTFSGQVFSPGTCTFTITRTWVATDLAANTVSVSQVITVQDIVGPVFNPAFLPTGIVNINVANSLACTGNYTLNVVNITDVSDACNGVSGIGYSLVPASGAPSSGVLTLAAGTFTLPVSSFPIGNNVVTLTASDGCGNLTTKVVTIIVTDNQAPVFQNFYAADPAGRCGKIYVLPNTTNNCDQIFTWTRPVLNDITDCGAFTVTEVIDNDNNPMTPNSVQQFVNLINPFVAFPPVSPNVVAQFPVGETVVKYTATQGANVSVCSFTVRIEDTQTPVITCPPNTSLSISSACANAATIPVYSPASILDNCINNVTITQTPPAGSLVSLQVPVVPGNSFVVQLQASDIFANHPPSVPCNFTVTLVDGQSPVPLITNLPDITSNCTKDTVFAPLAKDCNGVDFDTIYGTPSVQVMMILPPLMPGGPPRYVLNPGSYVITWSYTDPQNNTTTQPQNVFINVDLVGPVAIAQSLVLNLNAMGVVTVTAAQLNNGSFDQDGCGPVGVSIRIGTAPNFQYVNSIQLTCANLANNGVNPIVFAATDINGNITLAAPSPTVTIKDVTPPTFVGPWSAGQMDTVIQACSAVPPAAAFPQLAIDQCDLVVNITLAENSTQTVSGCSLYSYVVTRTWTATDDSGNTATRTQKIIVADTQAPVFAVNTPATIVANTAPNAQVCSAAVSFNMAAFVSDCEAAADLTITNSLISAPVGNTFVIPAGSNISAPNYPVGTYVVRFTATDKCGNSSTKDVTIKVNDVTPPTAVCINGVSASLQPSGTVNVTVNQFNNNSYDNCSDALGLLIQRLDQNPLVAPSATLEYNCTDADGMTQHGVKLFVADDVGNMSMCLTYIVIQDNVSPTITCPPNKTVQCTDILTPAVQGIATAIDNCPIIDDSISYSDAIGGGVGNICQVLTRTWKVIDLADNVSTCNQLLSIQDTVKPVFTTLPPNVTVSCSDGSIAVIPVGATDNCDPNVDVVLTVDTISIAQGDCGLFDYTIVRTWTATDDCGNVNIHTRLIKVVDITDPEFAGMPDTLILNTSQFPPNLTCSVPLVLNVAQFLEDCSPDSLLLVTNDAPFGDNSFIISGDYPIGDYWVHFAAIDVCGNVGIDSIFIQVIDNSVPTMVCNNNVVISLGTNGEAIIDANDIDLGSIDNCAIDTTFLSQNMFDCGDLGAQTVVLTAMDIYGNTNTCAVQVQVTLGVNSGFNLSASGTPESYFGADNGTGTAVATGGTGLFSYLWSNSDTTAVVSGLAAGTYTVSVTDVNSGCISLDTVIVNAGAKITLTVGTDNDCQGQIISIPVSASNFINVTGFNFGLALSNGVAGNITGITNVNAALTGLIAGVNTVFWAQPNQIPTNLPDGSVLFNIQIQLSNAAVGTSSNIVASALPVLIFLQDGTNQAPMVNFNSGSATIGCVAPNDLEVAGNVFTWKAPVKPVPGVTLTLGGTANDTDLTALPDAVYSFFVASGSNTMVSGSKIATVKNQQINVGDMLGIQAHAALQVAFNNGFQWVAADINGDQRVNLLDYALVQKYVLGNGAHFTDNQGNQVGPDWKFISGFHQFMPLPLGNPAAPMPNPLNNPAPATIITHNNVMVDFLSDNIVAVLVGDVNGSVIPSLTNGGGGTENAEALKFRLDERALQMGEIVTVPFKALDFTNAQAYQMTIGFDPEVLELQDIHEGVLPGMTEDNFGTDYLVDGLLSTLWIGNKPSTFNDNETLFSLTFRVLKSVPSLSDVLQSSSSITEALAIDETGKSIPVEFEFVASVSTDGTESKMFALYQNQPNPFTSETSISFTLPEPGRATLRVYSAEGRLVKTVIGEFGEGMNVIRFQKGDFGSNGVFYYELETPKHSDRKKMILID
ncbi:MAG: HYR domain-containing protein [Saprospiraceae bacterium]